MSYNHPLTMADPLFRNSDRRRDPRIGARFEVKFTSPTAAAKAFKVFSVNFSAGGLCVRTKHPHAVGDVVQLDLSVEGQVFALKGSVQWVRNDVLGVRFVDLTVDERQRLEKVAQTLLVQGVPVEP